jgi:long-chain acyl-CoA synthetase
VADIATAGERSLTARAEPSAPRAALADTFPKLLLRNAETFATRPAIRHKDLGIWQGWTWAQVKDEVVALSVGLAELGLERGDHFAIIGRNKPRLYWAICAGQALGAVPVPLYADSVAEEMAYVLEHAEVTLAVVEDQEQVDKILSIQERLTTLRHIVYDERRGLRDYDHARLTALDDVQRNGREALGRDPERLARWQAEVAAGKGSDLAIILYTSGTTGRPKGVMLSHANVLVSAHNGNVFDNLGPDEEVIAYLPLAWVGDHIFSYAQSYDAGFCVNCPEAPETVVEDRREIGTTYAFAPPRIYENLITITMVRMEDAGALKRRMFDFFIAVARRWGERILNREKVPLHARVLYALGELLVYGPLKNRFGLSRIRVAYTAGEAIGPEIFVFFRALGINVKQLYGMTESSVFVAVQKDGDVRLDTVGTPMPEVDIKISESGEVLFRSPGVFVGYYKNDEATAQTVVDGRVPRCGGPPEDHRSRPRRLATRRRHDVRAQVSREQAEVLAVREGSGLHRAGQALRDRAGQHRLRGGRQLGGTPGDYLHQLHRSRRQARGVRPHPRRSCPGQPQPARRRNPQSRADPEVPGPAQGARSGRRGDHPYAEGAARLYCAEVRGAHRGALRRGGARPGRRESDV